MKKVFLILIGILKYFCTLLRVGCNEKEDSTDDVNEKEE